jgi:flagellar hook capping protein FlgD
MGRHAATAVVLLLLVGTAVAFAETERLKLKPTPIEESFVQTAFSPVCRCAQAHAVIRLRLHRADTVDVNILDAAGNTVRVLAEGKRLPRGRTQLAWDGRDDEGSRVPDGSYGVEVHLSVADRTFKLPQQTVLDTVAPTTRYVFSSGPAKPGRRFRILYRISEPAHGVLYVNGRRTIVTHTKLRSAKLDWRPQRRGRYRLQLAAVDLAGNLGPRTRVFFVGVR